MLGQKLNINYLSFAVFAYENAKLHKYTLHIADLE